MRSLNVFLLLYFIGNSNYLIINCVLKLVWGCSQAIRLRHINKGFYSILPGRIYGQVFSVSFRVSRLLHLQGLEGYKLT